MFEVLYSVEVVVKTNLSKFMRTLESQTYFKSNNTPMILTIRLRLCTFGTKKEYMLEEITYDMNLTVLTLSDESTQMILKHSDTLQGFLLELIA